MSSKNEIINGTYVGSKEAHISSVMPLIPVGLPKITPNALNKSCYINATECKPSVASTINSQNFLTIVKNHSEDDRKFSFGDSLQISSKDGNYYGYKLKFEND